MIWLIGCNGMLGTELGRQLTQKNIPWVGSGSEVDITDPEALDTFAEAHDRSANRTGSTAAKGMVPRKITWVVNCAAWTNVDGAESNEEQAKKLNDIGALNIARATRKIGAKLIHISTDYVFDGSASSPYTEDSPKSPLGIYGATKSSGEDAIQKEMTQFYILRTSWLYGFDGRNFVYTMTKTMNQNESVKVVDDQRGCPTFAGDLASAIIKIIDTSDNAHRLFGKNAAIPYGIYHYTDQGSTTWFEFAKKIFEYGRKHKKITQNCAIEPCTTADCPTPAKRPAYSVLSTEKIQRLLKIKIPSWEDSLERFMKSSSFAIR
ncbi:MAG: dTDP-4-dehydrorhamnose reductase [Treponema sp.]|nr:dTDP-4-dehydrorhamnose reductase [Treponema sp.]